MMRRLLLILPLISFVSEAFVVLPSSTTATSSSKGRRQIISSPTTTPTTTASYKIIIPTTRQQQQEKTITTISSSSSSYHHPHHHCTTRLSLANNNNDDNNNSSNSSSNNESTTPSTSPINFSNNKSIPQLIGTIFLIVLTFGSITNLFTREIPMVLTGDPQADYLGAVFDTLFVGWATQTLWLQTGALADSLPPTASDDDEKSISIIDLDGLECRIDADIGRESGTWMDKDWAASGGRLVLPIKVKFTNEQIDLGIPGEEGLGGRYCRRLQVLDDQIISFVGQQGQVTVNVQDGGWATLPILNQKLEAGERKLRFFLDFPQGAQRNDVTIPKGRVYFSSACLPLSSSLGNDSSSSSSIVSTSLINAPSGDGIFKEGGITIKSNGGILNLWGAAGDINLILGRYSVSEL